MQNIHINKQQRIAAAAAGNMDATCQCKSQAQSWF